MLIVENKWRNEGAGKPEEWRHDGVEKAESADIECFPSFLAMWGAPAPPFPSFLAMWGEG